jgi:hypothetical protein
VTRARSTTRSPSTPAAAGRHTSVEPVTLAAPSVIDPATLTEHGTSDEEEELDAIEYASEVGRFRSRDADVEAAVAPADDGTRRTAWRGVAARVTRISWCAQCVKNAPRRQKGKSAQSLRREKGRDALRRSEPLPAARG